MGKPASLFGITDPAETAFSEAYAPTLAALIEVLGERLSHRELETLMREVGRRLSATAPRATGSLDARVNAGVKTLGALGAVADVHGHGATFTVTGFGCPLGKAVAVRPETCRAVEQVLAQATGARVREQCVRDQIGGMGISRARRIGRRGVPSEEKRDGCQRAEDHRGERERGEQG